MPRIHVASFVIASVLLSPALACAQEGHPVGRGALIVLSASVTSLQAYDTYSTLAALKHGAVEANPLMQGVVKHPGAFVALKGGIAIGPVYAATQLWRRHHRGAALVLRAVTSGAAAAVAAHNASVLRTARGNGR